MEKIKPKSAFFVKLGSKGGYEKDSLSSPGNIHVGWTEIPHEICESKDWEEVKRIEFGIFKNHSTASNRTKQLRNFYETSDETLWITFYNDHLYWCFANPLVTPLKDGSRVRSTLLGWNYTDTKGNPLDVSRLSGSLLAIQGFRSTICQVKEFEYLLRKINCETSPLEQQAISARENLIQSLVKIIQDLNWKEFELLTDLIFRQAGWQRLGVLGETTKDIDLDLLSPIDNERYKVQVKSEAGINDLQAFTNLASANRGFARYYFVVHKPASGLAKGMENLMVKIWLPEEIARLAVNYGLVDWLIRKTK